MQHLPSPAASDQQKDAYLKYLVEKKSPVGLNASPPDTAAEKKNEATETNAAKKSPRYLSPRNVSPRQHPMEKKNEIIGTNAAKKSPRTLSPRNVSPRQKSPAGLNASPLDTAAEKKNEATGWSGARELTNRMVSPRHHPIGEPMVSPRRPFVPRLGDRTRVPQAERVAANERILRTFRAGDRHKWRHLVHEVQALVLTKSSAVTILNSTLRGQMMRNGAVITSYLDGASHVFGAIEAHNTSVRARYIVYLIPEDMLMLPRRRIPLEGSSVDDVNAYNDEALECAKSLFTAYPFLRTI